MALSPKGGTRPLSYMHNDADEPQPLTPAHFLVGIRLTSLLPKTMIPETQSANLNRENMSCRGSTSIDY